MEEFLKMKRKSTVFIDKAIDGQRLMSSHCGQCFQCLRCKYHKQAQDDVSSLN